MNKKGFDSFQLKIIALVFMTFDHIAYFLSGILPIPNWFHLIGRISAPIFIFIVANGFRYTRNRVVYMKRLYMWSIFMSVGNFIANQYFGHPLGAIVLNNIFATMFYIVFFLYFIHKLIDAIKNKKIQSTIISILMIVAPFVVEAILMPIVFSPASLELPYGTILVNAIMTFLPVPSLVEGSIYWIILGIGLYYCLNHKIALTIFYTLASGFFFVTAASGGITVQNLFILNNQWFMIMALPFLLLYNNKKGRGMKYLFYIYYPTHIYILLFLARILA